MTPKKYIIAICMLALPGCTAAVSQDGLAPVTDDTNDLTHGNVQLNLENGVTTQADVLEVFGAPNITTIDSQGREVWSYQRAATASQSTTASQSWTIILAGGNQSAAGFESTMRMMTLIIKFNELGIVDDFRSRTSSF